MSDVTTLRPIIIDGRAIGTGHDPYVIAEMSGNHNGQLDRAIRLIETAKAAGADAVKIQTYTADTITIDADRPDFRISGGPWDGRTLYDLYQEAHTPWEWHRPMFDRAREIGLTIFSSPFDKTAVDFLEDLNTPAYKIASFEAVDLPLVRYTAQTGKPLIVSTGMATEDEIAEVMETVREVGNDQLILLHCVSGYPTPVVDANISTITDMRARFGAVIGLSDHTLGTEVAVGAVALGAAVIEKHFTLTRADGGPDASFSLEQDELADLCTQVRNAALALGQPSYTLKDSEKENLMFRRSLYVVRDIEAGDTFTEDNVRSIRPGYGLAPKYFDDVIGKKATDAVARGTPLDWFMIRKTDNP